MVDGGHQQLHEIPEIWSKSNPVSLNLSICKSGRLSPSCHNYNCTIGISDHDASLDSRLNI